jgi:hypothetical protein
MPLASWTATKSDPTISPTARHTTVIMGHLALDRFLKTQKTKLAIAAVNRWSGPNSEIHVCSPLALHQQLVLGLSHWTNVGHVDPTDVTLLGRQSHRLSAN